MRLMLKGLTIDDRTKKYIEKRVLPISKLLKNPAAIEIEIDIDKKGKFRVEVMSRDPYNQFRSEHLSESIEGSIDMAIDQLKIQIIKDKDKRETLIKRGGRSIKKKVALDKNARF